MEQNRMTIHRGLAELKLIDSKINKQTNEITPSAVVQNDKLVEELKTKDEFTKQAKSNLNSILDLIDRKTKIKSAIVKANNETLIKIAGQEMSISDAISYKQIINFKGELVSTLKRKHALKKKSVIENNIKVETNALKLAESILKRDNVKITDNDVISATKPYFDTNEYTLLDPLKIDEVIAKLEQEVENFKTEIDAVLSEANATTFITF